MKKIFAVFLICSFFLPVRAGIVIASDREGPVRLAGLVSDFDPIEKKLLEGGASSKFQEEMQKQIKKDQAEPSKAELKEAEKSGSNWWKWALGILVVGGIAAAAGGGGGGGNTPPTPPGGTTVTGSW